MEQSNGRKKVLLAIPCSNGFIHHELDTVETLWSHDQTIAITIMHYPYRAPLDSCRNEAVRYFLNGDFDYFCMIDNDIVPPHNALRMLLDADKDIISPVCFTMKDDDSGLLVTIPVACRYNSNLEYIPYYGKGVEKTNVITGGMFLIKAIVLQTMKERNVTPFAFLYDSDGVVEYSEDFVFSKRAEALGFEIYTHYDILCKHYRTVDLLSLNNLLVKVSK